MLAGDTFQTRLISVQLRLLGLGNYGLSQADLYPLFAYGQHYLEGQGELVLIYPRTSRFSRIEAPFEFNAELRLWVCGFDLDRDCLDWPGNWPQRLGIPASQGAMPS